MRTASSIKDKIMSLLRCIFVYINLIILSISLALEEFGNMFDAEVVFSFYREVSQVFYDSVSPPNYA
jgi:hypothetical protein